MKKIRMLQSMAGPDESWQPGDERDVADYIADEWCKPEVGIAELAAVTAVPPVAGPTPAAPPAKSAVHANGGKAR